MKQIKKIVILTLAVCLLYGSNAVASVPGEVTETQNITVVRSTGEGLVITWDPMEAADIYCVFRRTEDEKWKCIARISAEQDEEEGKQDGISWTDSMIIPGETYLYCVRGYHEESGQWSRMEEKGMTGVWEVTPEQITAGTVLTEEAVKAMGEDSFFYTEEISDEVFARMWKKSFKEYCTVDRTELRYIRCLHKDIDGKIKVGELVMSELVADSVCGIFRQLYDAAYPIESMILVDEFDADDETSIMANNTSAFNYRTVDNTDQISNHAYGLAIDINPYYNVYYIPSENYVFPPEGWAYLDRETDFPYKLMPGDLCYNLFTEAGFNWGGWWTYNTDYQHFEYTP